MNNCYFVWKVKGDNFVSDDQKVKRVSGEVIDPVGDGLLAMLSME